MSVEFRGKEFLVKEKKGLRTLNLSQKRIKDISEIKGLEKLTDLQVLNLRYNFITEIRGLETLKNLKILNLSQNRVKKIGGLDTLTNLEVLNFRNNDINIIEGLENLNSLKELDVWSNNITQINNYKILKQLSVFIVSGNPIDGAVQNFAGSTKSEKLHNFIHESDEMRTNIMKDLKQKELILQHKNITRGEGVSKPSYSIGRSGIALVLLIIGIIVAALTFMAIPALTNGSIRDYFQQGSWWIMFIPAGICIVPALCILESKK